jgi:hypothetical protein
MTQGVNLRFEKRKQSIPHACNPGLRPGIYTNAQTAGVDYTEFSITKMLYSRYWMLDDGRQFKLRIDDCRLPILIAVSLRDGFLSCLVTEESVN